MCTPHDVLRTQHADIHQEEDEAYTFPLTLKQKTKPGAEGGSGTQTPTMVVNGTGDAAAA